MSDIYESALLFDFYGELLTEHQKKIYADRVYNDMSMSEIAEENGISRQAVHDLIKRCNDTLQEYENKLHLVERFKEAKKISESISRLSDTQNSGNEAQDIYYRIARINELANKLIPLL
ncbi:MAG: DNA-binding protein [Lachnospiraceae bacterium]|nr:DNA-binding protein [Lachnospiraceae bacterium]